MSIKLSNKDEETIRELSAKITQIRAEEYEKAVKELEISRKQSNTLSDKISRAEINNLIIARPSLPKRPNFKTPEDVEKYIGKLREKVEYGVENERTAAIYHYVGAVNKTWGSEAAQQIMNIAQTNPEKFIKCVNAGKFPAVQYVYYIKDPEVQAAYIDEMYDIMEE